MHVVRVVGGNGVLWTLFSKMLFQQQVCGGVSPKKGSDICWESIGPTEKVKGRGVRGGKAGVSLSPVTCCVTFDTQYSELHLLSLKRCGQE